MIQTQVDSPKNPFQLPRLFERDVDLLLAEEFQVSAKFASAFLSELNLEGFLSGAVVRAHVSKSDASGESDLVVIFEKPDSVDRFAIFIEDKIDAPFQPEQLARYRHRAKSGEGYADSKVVLLSPETYLTADIGFDAQISYESIAEILKAAEPGARSSYRSEAMLLAAKNARKAPPTKEFDSETTAFWLAAYKIALSQFPELEMKPVRQPTKGLTWLQLQPIAMTRKPVFISLLLKGDKGVIELAFLGIDSEKLYPRLSPLLQNGMTLAKSGEARLAIRMKSPKFEITPFDEKAATTLREAFEVCKRLILFYEMHKADLDSAAAQSILPPKPLSY